MDAAALSESLNGPQAYVLLATAAITTLFFFTWYTFDSEAAVDYSVEPPEQCSPGWKGRVLDEPSLKAAGSNNIQCYAPATGQFLDQITPASEKDIDNAVARAKEAQKQWKNTTFSERRQVLKTLLKFVLENQQTISTAACLDSGKTRVDSSFGEILVTAEKLKWTIDHGEKALTPERRPTNFLMMYKKNEVRWEPLGVVAACVSWNYPFHNLVGPIISALFSGNAVIVKVSEQTAWSSQYFTRVVHGALSACGYESYASSLVQTVVTWPEVAGHFTSHPGISHLTFIGSRPVAHKVCESAAKSLIPVCVELGGKDAAIILDDVRNLEKVGHILLRGVFQAAGQNCIGIERVVALPKAYDRLLDFLTPRIRALRSGSVLSLENSNSADSIDVGASISAASFANLEAMIQEAVAQGARLLAGGSRYAHPDHPKGHYFSPTLLADVTPAMRIAQTECFAPVFLLMRAASVADAVSIANSTEYGLGASVFGTRRADLEFVVDNVASGMVSVNDFAVYYAVQLPFGGVKGSGYGRFAGEEGLRGLCNTKAVCRDRFPGIIETGIPPELRVPVGDMRRAWQVACGVVELGYGESLGRKVKGLRRVVGI
ncbi:Aldehyde dehydrogenase [Lasiodiplodia theobromae]|uniref:Aldehyde dehydrogenase n=1 Tax=Lasiodiplodia theobromae TaxID=45133 RepID=UPI0015C334EF|nr:Aldehyde dehydrogenase [Lasiodiplodia theobromae]KAF4537504.1 Aldehyde dehydrogenase [Lasiodiplodia theobromae]